MTSPTVNEKGFLIKVVRQAMTALGEQAMPVDVARWLTEHYPDFPTPSKTSLRSSVAQARRELKLARGEVLAPVHRAVKPTVLKPALTTLFYLQQEIAKLNLDVAGYLKMLEKTNDLARSVGGFNCLLEALRAIVAFTQLQNPPSGGSHEESV